MYNKAYQPYYRTSWRRRRVRAVSMTTEDLGSRGHDLAGLAKRLLGIHKKEHPVLFLIL
jgi:hypothetical protein